jgi:hypothetical protein
VFMTIGMQLVPYWNSYTRNMRGCRNMVEKRLCSPVCDLNRCTALRAARGMRGYSSADRP